VTKGGHARVVFMNARLRREIEQFRSTLPAPPPRTSPCSSPRSARPSARTR
jgi:integrase/recombinase XerD